MNPSRTFLVASSAALLSLLPAGTRVFAQQVPEHFDQNPENHIDGSSKVGSDDRDPEHYVIHNPDGASIVQG